MQALYPDSVQVEVALQLAAGPLMILSTNAAAGYAEMFAYRESHGLWPITSRLGTDATVLNFASKWNPYIVFTWAERLDRGPWTGAAYVIPCFLD